MDIKDELPYGNPTTAASKSDVSAVKPAQQMVEDDYCNDYNGGDKSFM